MFSRIPPAPEDDLTDLRKDIVMMLEMAGRTKSLPSDKSRVLSCLDADKLEAYKTYLHEHTIYMIGNAVNAMRYSGKTDVATDLTLAHVDAIQAIYEVMSEPVEVDPKMDIKKILAYTFQNAKEVSLIGSALRRGIYDVDQISQTVAAMRTVQPALRNGAL